MMNFMEYYHDDMLPEEGIFSILSPAHRKITVEFFEMMYYAKDFDTFYNISAWARSHVNRQMFTYALYVAVIHRPDTVGIILPPIYEVNPYYFFNTEVMTKAKRYKQMFIGDGITSEDPSYKGERKISDNVKFIRPLGRGVGLTLAKTLLGWFANKMRHTLFII